MSDDKNSPHKPLTGLSFLILEDEVIIALALEKTLEEFGAESVQIALSIVEAKIKLQQDRFDVGIVDLRLPDGDASKLAAEMVAEKVAIVVHSGHADLGHLDDIPGAAYCPKPATQREIMRAVNAARALVEVSNR
jgi:DNA-binding NtrC family response regulator